MPDNPNFSPKLAGALCAVSRDVKQLGKSERNDFAKYNFVSVDRFYEAIGGLMAGHGVHAIPDCVESEVIANAKTGKPLLRERWAFTLIHESGECAGPYHRTVTVPAEGAQAHGSSESYAQKQFLRGVFRVPTGDKDDADYSDKAEHGVSKRKSAAQAKRDGDNETVKSMIEACKTVEELDERWRVIEDDWLPVLPEKWFDHINDYYMNRRDELQAVEAA